MIYVHVYLYLYIFSYEAVIQEEISESIRCAKSQVKLIKRNLLKIIKTQQKINLPEVFLVSCKFIALR